MPPPPPGCWHGSLCSWLDKNNPASKKVDLKNMPIKVEEVTACNYAGE
jgi:hypothetical protein